MNNIGEKTLGIARGGIFCALCLIILFLSLIIPEFSFIAAAFAGICIMIVQDDNGPKVALMVYASVSLLCFFLVPDILANTVFIFFFGYYSVAKGFIENSLPKHFQKLVKFLLFNCSMFIVYFIIIKLFGMDYLLEEDSTFGNISMIIVFIMSNIVLVLYDSLLEKIKLLYDKELKKYINRKY